MDDGKKIRRQIALSFAPRIINLFVVPLQISLLTKHLSVSEYGIWSMLLNTGFVATLAFTFGLQKVLSIKVPGRTSLTQLKFFKAILIAESISYIIISLIFICFLLPIFIDTLKIPNYEQATIIILAAFFANLLYNEIGRLFNYQKRLEVFLLTVSLEKIFELALLYTAIKHFNITNINDLAAAYIILYTTLLFINLAFFKKTRLYLKIKIRKSIIKHAFIFGAPLFLSDIAWKLIQNVDYYMLSGFDRKTELSIYAFISRITNYVYLAASPIIWVVYPYLVTRYKESGNKTNKAVLEMLSLQLKYSYVFLLAATGIILVNIDLFISLFATPEYSTDIHIYFFYTPYPFLLASMYIGQQILLLRKKTKLITTSYFLGLLINIIGNWLLIPKFGISGAIFSTLLSLVAVVTIQSKNFSPTQYISIKLFVFLLVEIFIIYHISTSSIGLLWKNIFFTTQLLLLSLILKIIKIEELRSLKKSHH